MCTFVCLCCSLATWLTAAGDAKNHCILFIPTTRQLNAALFNDLSKFREEGAKKTDLRVKVRSGVEVEVHREGRIRRGSERQTDRRVEREISG